MRRNIWQSRGLLAVTIPADGVIEHWREKDAEQRHADHRNVNPRWQSCGVKMKSSRVGAGVCVPTLSTAPVHSPQLPPASCTTATTFGPISICQASSLLV